MVETETRTGAPGIEFTETMRGFVTVGDADLDYELAHARGRSAGSPLEFTVTVTAPDLDRMIADPGHEALLRGTVSIPALSPSPLRVEEGRFQLLVRDTEEVGTRKMFYRMPMMSSDGRRFLLEGFKTVRDDTGPDLWSDTTTLYVTVRADEKTEPVVARGIVRIHISDFRKQLGTMRAIGARSRLEELRTLARFGSFFLGALNEVYGGVFAKPSAFDPEAPPRERRPLHTGPPEIRTFQTGDGVGLRLTRFEGGRKGPVILSPGFGTSALAFTIDTTAINLPEFLFERGYDVWVLDYRASPDLPSASAQFTLDDIALHDYPAAVEEVLAATGADSVQVVAHCVGSLTLLMALAAGLRGVRSVVSSQLTLHPRVVPLNKLRSGLYVANLLTAVGVDTLTTGEGGEDEVGEGAKGERGWMERLYDAALRLYPAGRERCESQVCRRILFMYGEVFDHDQLNPATHDALHEMFGVANLRTFKQIARSIRKGHVVSAEGEDVYLPATERFRLPISFLHGEHNRLFLPEGSRLTWEYLARANGVGLYQRHVVPGYAHMDCFIGKNAARDVYPLVAAELDRHNPRHSPRPSSGRSPQRFHA